MVCGASLTRKQLQAEYHNHRREAKHVMVMDRAGKSRFLFHRTAGADGGKCQQQGLPRGLSR
jgi:hypothetical protein